MNGLAIKNLAHAIAVVAHDGQSRKGLGEPYINHVERVADSVYGWHSKSVCYLHDVVEDTDITLENLIAVGIPYSVIVGVDLLTRRKNEVYSSFIDRIILFGDKDFISIKIADIKDNMRDIDDTDMPSLKIRYMKALALLEESLLS